MSRQFIKLHVDLLDNPEYQDFFGTPANLIYMAIMERVFWGDWKNPGRVSNHPLYGFWREGWLCARVSLRELHKRIPRRSVRSILNDIHRLEELGVIDTYRWPDDGSFLIQVGFWTWATAPNGRREFTVALYVDRVFSPDYYPRTEEELP